MNGDRPARFLAACGVAGDHIESVVEQFRTTGERLGGGVLRVRVGPGVAQAQLSLAGADLLTPARA